MFWLLSEEEGRREDEHHHHQECQHLPHCKYQWPWSTRERSFHIQVLKMAIIGVSIAGILYSHIIETVRILFIVRFVKWVSSIYINLGPNSRSRYYVNPSQSLQHRPRSAQFVTSGLLITEERIWQGESESLLVSMSVLFWSREVRSEPNNANVTLSRNNHNLQFSTFLCVTLNVQHAKLASFETLFKFFLFSVKIIIFISERNVLHLIIPMLFLGSEGKRASNWG